MDILLNETSLVLLLLIYASRVLTQKTSCGAPTGKHFLKIPRAMDLDEFVSSNVGIWMGEMYYALPRPPAYTPDYNYYSKFTRTSDNTFLQDTMGDVTSGGQTTCARRPENMTLANNNEAFFTMESVRRVQVFWSSCPGNYLWSMHCNDWDGRSSRCRLDETVIGLYAVNSLDDLSLDSAVSDLCQTGTKFGAQDHKWFFTYGQNQYC